MKKTMKMFSITLMSVAMAICFMFAGAFMAKAATVNDVTLSAEQGAYVLVGGTAEETGIKFDFKVNASEYDALINDNPEATIKLGVLVGKASAGEVTESNFIEAYEVKTGAEGLTEAGEFYNYSFAITYNLEQVFNSLKEAEMLDANLEYADASEDATFNAYVNQMYARELVLRPFVSVDGVKALGTASEARAMLHVAQAEIAANAANLPEGFAEKYIKETIDRTADEVTISAEGVVAGIADEIVALTVGTNGKVVGRNATTITEMAVVEQAIVDGKVELYGYGADRTVYKYLATYVAGGSEEANEISEELVLSATDGKLYFNGSELAGKTASSVLYNGTEILSAGVIDASGISEEKGSIIELKAVVDGTEYVLKNVLLCDLAVENTPASRAQFAGTFKDDVNDEGYYALVENIYFDVYNGGASASRAEQFGTSPADREVYFSGTIDGRGYGLNDIMIMVLTGTSMFGKVTGTAVVKDISINAFNQYNTKGSSGTTLINHSSANISSGGGLLFRTAAADADITFDNVYVNIITKASSYMINSSQRWAVFFKEIATGAKVTLNNVFVETKVTTSGTKVHNVLFGANVYTWGSVSAGVTINNSFFITNSVNMGYEKGTGVPELNTSIGDIQGTNKGKYDAIADFTADVESGFISINSFDNAMWDITSGVPVWKGLSK